MFHFRVETFVNGERSRLCCSVVHNASSRHMTSLRSNDKEVAVVLLGHRREEAFRGPEQTQIVDAESTAQRKQVLEGERNKESRKRIGGIDLQLDVTLGSLKY